MKKTRVNKGEKYWFINSFGEVVSKTESGVIDDAKRFEAGNYFSTKEEAESMANKLRAVLDGADVIEMPSEEEGQPQTAEEWYDRLWEICEEMAEERNNEHREHDEEEGYTEDEDYDFFEVDANGYDIDKGKRVVSFSFTMMNEKWWDDIPFDRMREEYGLDMDKYID